VIDFRTPIILGITALLSNGGCPDLFCREPESAILVECVGFRSGRESGDARYGRVPPKRKPLGANGYGPSGAILQNRAWGKQWAVGQKPWNRKQIGIGDFG